MQPVGAIEGSTVILPWLRSAVTINKLQDGKYDLAGLDGLLQLANMVAGFSPMLLLLTVSAGSYSDQISDKHICHPQQKV